MKPRYVIAGVTALVLAAGGGYTFAQTTSTDRPAQGSCVDNPDGSQDCHIHIAPPATTIPPSTGPPITTVPVTTLPSTTAVPTSTTPVTTVPRTTAPPTTVPPTTAPPAGVLFSEDFSTPGSFLTRFTHGWSGGVQSGALFGENKNDWAGDHDVAMCGDPTSTHRAIHVTPPANEVGAPAGSVKNIEAVFYQCAPGGDNAKAHLMTSVNTDGYVIAWFTPNRTFTDVHKVCWDQSFTHLGGGKWTTVTFLTPAEYNGKTDLGYNDPEFADPNGPDVPNGVAGFGVQTGHGNLQAWQNHQFSGSASGLDLGTDHASRMQTCVRDNENGTLTINQGSRAPVMMAGQIPNGTIRVVFNDDNYNPDKHYDTTTLNGTPPPPFLYTWHWDNIDIEG